MHQFYDYDAYIFDCDGVLLDSNKIKIKAMREALCSCDHVLGGIDEAIDYFSGNFGRSRFHHIKQFCDKFLVLRDLSSKHEVEQSILDLYDRKVEELYPNSPIIPHVKSVLSQLSGECYVASGSEQSQLRRVLSKKDLSGNFRGIYGSPEKKSQIVRNILLSRDNGSRAIMIGDSIADLEAARENAIDFIGIIGFSNTPRELSELCSYYGYPTVKDWKKVVQQSVNVGIVIPARYKSTRLPGKPLIDLCGKSMIQRTWEQCCQVLPKKQVYIATESDLVASHVSSFGAQVVMTSDGCLTGTDRLAEANEKLNLDVVINVQGDEPVISPSDINAVINYSKSNPNVVVNAVSEIHDESEFRSLTIPKVAFTKEKKLLYMSRSPIPGSKQNSFGFGYKQICIYAFPKEALRAFSKVEEKTQFESMEDIEILRFLEEGVSVHLVEVTGESIAVDVAEDVDRVLDLIMNKKNIQ
jgi:3-deoxy-manno-octulosonate cytidylyltransferase (CMP-KDO synthetase)